MNEWQGDGVQVSVTSHQDVHTPPRATQEGSCEPSSAGNVPSIHPEQFVYGMLSFVTFSVCIHIHAYTHTESYKL